MGYGVWREEPGDCGKDMGLCMVFGGRSLGTVVRIWGYVSLDMSDGNPL